jgi:hypothetical protein
MKISQFFEQALGAKFVNVRWSWGAVHPTTNQVFLRVWDDHLEKDQVLVFRDRWKSLNSAGFSERKRHIELVRSGARGYGVLCTGEDRDDGGRVITSFDKHQLLELGELKREKDRVFARVLGRIPVHELQNSRASASPSLLGDLKSIWVTKVAVTQREQLIAARVGQGQWRQEVLKIWGCQCCVSGSTVLEAVRASHIKPWQWSTATERLDPENGLPLIATIDALFDAGLVTFSDAKLIPSSVLTEADLKKLGVKDCRMLRTPSERTAEYLTYHRERVFRK